VPIWPRLHQSGKAAGNQHGVDPDPSPAKRSEDPYPAAKKRKGPNCARPGKKEGARHFSGSLAAATVLRVFFEPTNGSCRPRLGLLARCFLDLGSPFCPCSI
jgi:hypothetical protein